MTKRAFLTIIIALFILLLAVTAEYYFLHQPRHETVTVKINHYLLTGEIARTPAQQRTGLAGRKYLAENQAMLFIYSYEQYLSFWMKGMKIPIDIIWLDKDYRILSILANLPPCTSPEEVCPIYTPPVWAQYVLETRAGFSARHHLQTGQRIELVTVHDPMGKE